MDPVFLLHAKVSSKKYKAHGNKINSKGSQNMSEEIPCFREALKQMSRQVKEF